MGPVPIESYVIHLADRIDILIDQNKPVLLQSRQILQEIMARANVLFHPELCEVFEELIHVDRFWLDIDNMSMDEVLNKVDCDFLEFDLTLDLLEQMAFTISKFIDFRSKFTVSHSFGVSKLAKRISELSGYNEVQSKKLEIAGLLHDIGKIGIDVEILEKPGPLNELERKHIQEHAYYTNKILFMTKELQEIGEWASHHHENHGGGGYPDNYSARNITEEMDIIAYADVFTALAEKRPYRDGLSLENIITKLKGEFEVKHGTPILKLIINHQDELYDICQSAIKDGLDRYNEFSQRAKQYEQAYQKIQLEQQ